MNLELEQQLSRVYSDLQIFFQNSNLLFTPMILDLMFIMDCTESMSPWIDKCRNSIFDILENVKIENPECTIRMSFVGYRDLDYIKEDQFKILDFTSDPNTFTEFLNKV